MNPLLETHPSENERAPESVDDVRAPLDTMPHSSFSSSNVHSALYDYGEIELYVRYLREGPDAIYKYSNVPAAEWDGLVGAASKGSYINANIAYQYLYQKLSRSDFPDRGHGVTSDLARRFLTSP